MFNLADTPIWVRSGTLFAQNWRIESHMDHQRIDTNTVKADDEINLLELVSDIWKQKWLIAVFVGLALLYGIIQLNTATYNYTAELRVTPAQPSQVNRMKASGVSGLASIAGLSIPQSTGAASFELYAEGLHSRNVADRLVKNTDLMKTIFSSEWNAKTNQFVEPPATVRTQIVRGLKSLLGLPVYSWEAPDAARLQDYIETQVRVSEDMESPVVTLTFEHPDPKFAVTFLTALHNELDDNLRQKALTRSNQYINYLTNQLQRVTIAEHRAAIADTLSEQEKTRMMASSSLAFAADPFGPVTTSLRPTSPNPTIVLALSIVIGAFSGILVAVLRTQVRAYRRVQVSDVENTDV